MLRAQRAYLLPITTVGWSTPTRPSSSPWAKRLRVWRSRGFRLLRAEQANCTAKSLCAISLRTTAGKQLENKARKHKASAQSLARESCAESRGNSLTIGNASVVSCGPSVINITFNVSSLSSRRANRRSSAGAIARRCFPEAIPAPVGT